MNTKKTNLKQKIMQIFLFVFMLHPMLLSAREINVTGCRDSRENLAVMQEINALDKLIHQVFRFKKVFHDPGSRK